jgi:hypothetical protein
MGEDVKVTKMQSRFMRKVIKVIAAIIVVHLFAKLMKYIVSTSGDIDSFWASLGLASLGTVLFLEIFAIGFFVFVKLGNPFTKFLTKMQLPSHISRTLQQSRGDDLNSLQAATKNADLGRALYFRARLRIYPCFLCILILKDSILAKIKGVRF